MIIQLVFLQIVSTTTVIYIFNILLYSAYFSIRLFRRYPHRGTRFIFSAMSLRAGPLQRLHVCTGHTRTRVAFWECVHEWMPLCPPRFRTRRGKDGGVAGIRRGELSSSFFFNGSEDEAGPFGPYVDPSRELSDLTWSSSKRFSRSGPLYPAFFSSPKMAEKIQHGRARLSSVSLFPILACFSPPFFFSLRRKSIAHSVAPFNLRRVLCGGLRLGGSSSSIDARASFSSVKRTYHIIS